jgi:hypothetical protein
MSYQLPAVRTGEDGRHQPAASKAPRSGSRRDGPAGPGAHPANPPRGGPAGPWRPVTLREIVAAVPPGSRWVRRQKRLLTAFEAQPELGELWVGYTKGADTIKEVWRFLVRWAYRGDGLSMPVRSRLCEALGISKSTWQRARKWIEEHGWLGTVRGG